MNKIKININNPNRSKRNKPANKEAWYIYKVEYLLAAAFFKCAGGVGLCILNYLLWKRSMNGIDWVSLPNNHFQTEFKIPRQRKAEAVYKLERDNLIVCERQRGKPTLIKLEQRKITP